MHKLTCKLCDLLYCIARISLLFPKETNVLMKDAHNIINLVHLDLETNAFLERSSGERPLSVQKYSTKSFKCFTCNFSVSNNRIAPLTAVPH